jgi:hypothetical protein
VKSRTNPSFLSDVEANRERRRTEEFVKSITGTDHKLIENRPYNRKATIRKFYSGNSGRGRKQRPFDHRNYDYPKNKRIVGESSNFVVQFNRRERLIEIYGKDFFVGRTFKLKFSICESKSVINFLAMARNTLGHKCGGIVGETSRFIIESDRAQTIITICKKKNRLVKLGFNETETTFVIDLLMKARSLF